MKKSRAKWLFRLCLVGLVGHVTPFLPFAEAQDVDESKFELNTLQKKMRESEAKSLELAREAETVAEETEKSVAVLLALPPRFNNASQMSLTQKQNSFVWPIWNKTKSIA